MKCFFRWLIKYCAQEFKKKIIGKSSYLESNCNSRHILNQLPSNFKIRFFSSWNCWFNCCIGSHYKGNYLLFSWKNMEFFILGYGILIKYFLLNIDSYSKNYLSTYPHRIRSFSNKTYLKYFFYLLIFTYRTNKERKPFGEFVGGKPSFGAEWRPLGVCVAPRFF